MKTLIFKKIISPLIIAEIGVNHDGSFKKAIKLIDKAKEIGIKAVKFQYFKSDEIASNIAKKTPYQKNFTKKTENQRGMLKKLELSEEEMTKIRKYCLSKKIYFLCTPYSLSNAIFLQSINVDAIKIASSHAIENQFVKNILKLNFPTIISTGMFSNKEIINLSKLVNKNKNKNVCVMQCTSQYPSRISDSNLNVLKYYSQKFNCSLGFSDHTNEDISSMVSLAFGTNVFEKHFTLNKKDYGPDHSSSLQPLEMKNYIDKINLAHSSLGNFIKSPTLKEMKNMIFMRRSIHSKDIIYKNKIIKESDLIFKRPGDGISPNDIKKIIGKRAKIDIKKETKINFSNHIY